MVERDPELPPGDSPPPYPGDYDTLPEEKVPLSTTEFSHLEEVDSPERLQMSPLEPDGTLDDQMKCNGIPEGSHRHYQETGDPIWHRSGVPDYQYNANQTYNANGIPCLSYSDEGTPTGMHAQHGIPSPHQVHYWDGTHLHKIKHSDMTLDVNQYQISPQMGNTAVSNGTQIGQISSAPRIGQPPLCNSTASSSIQRPSTLFANGLRQMKGQRQSFQPRTSPHAISNHQQNFSNEQRQLYNMVIVGAEPDINYDQE